ncbi:MAG: FliM/FliN family flagellar motor switch protein [Candidatus Latescibacteria bacterium]|nr:FliM/FliN family flagellar motor switch protein [Candidatus Latescibacterota bacterium]
MAGQPQKEQPQGNIDHLVEEEMLKMMEEESKGGTPSIAQSDVARLAAPEEEVHLAQFQEFRGRSEPGAPPANIERLLDITLVVSAELGRKVMSIGEILELGEGAIVPLETLVGATIDLLVNNKQFAKGEVVTIGDNLGIRITNLVSPADRLKNL